MPRPEAQKIQVAMSCSGIKTDSMEFKMPAWTPGYYQLLNFANFVADFQVTGKGGKLLRWRKSSKNGWMVHTKGNQSFVITYSIAATVPFVAKNYVDPNRAYISPPGTFLYPANHLNTKVTVQFAPFGNWSAIATGLDPVNGKGNTFSAPNFDILYDCPVLIGNLDSFPSFSVNNIPHYFYAYQADLFDRNLLMADLKRIITTASGIIGEMPYKHYTFIGIGPGGGGIEHLNSTSVAFTGKELNDPTSRLRTYHFLTHEYFHHYNVKRIRPIELGPFDYDNGSRTKMLWFSEGVTVYYENLILKRAGLITTDDVFTSFQSAIKNYEDKPGKFFQTPAEASYSTWEDGPFGRTGDDYYKTISPYDKGPALGLLLDFKIRHETKNEKSLDDLMRLLYQKYYKGKARGFTEDEFRNAAETIAGVSLGDFFDYIYTVKPVDYTTYLNYAGLAIDTSTRVLPEGWSGIAVADRKDTLRVSHVEWESPAWKAGIRGGYAVVSVNGQSVNARQFNELAGAAHSGDQLNLRLVSEGRTWDKTIILGIKKEKTFTITRQSKPDALQGAILKGWLGE
nr:hypothetical protein [Flavihumibacter fluvii]